MFHWFTTNKWNTTRPWMLCDTSLSSVTEGLQPNAEESGTVLQEAHTHTYTHVLRLSLWLLGNKRMCLNIWGGICSGLICVWGRLAISQACVSVLLPSRSLRIFRTCLLSDTHALCERTDSACHRVLTQVAKRTGISSNSPETTRIKSSVSLSLSDQNSQSRAGSPTCRCQDEWHKKVRE